MADKREVLYQAISRDIEVMKDELMVEVRNSIAQVESLRDAIKSGNDESCELITKEIRYGYKQTEHVYSGMESILNDGIDEKLTALENKLSALEKLQAALDEIKGANESLASKVDGVDKTLGDVNTRLADAYLPTEDQCQKMIDGVNNNVEVHNQRVLDAIAAIPQAEDVDYTRIVEEVGDKVSALIDGIPQAKETEIDYDRIIDTTAERVAENIPAAEQVDYARIEGDVINALEKALDMEAIAAAVAAKIAIPQPQPVEVDYERLADMVAERLAAKEKTFEIVLDDEGLTKIAEKVAEKLVVEDENMLPKPRKGHAHGGSFLQIRRSELDGLSFVGLGQNEFPVIGQSLPQGGFLIGFLADTDHLADVDTVYVGVGIVHVVGAGDQLDQLPMRLYGFYPKAGALLIGQLKYRLVHGGSFRCCVFLLGEKCKNTEIPDSKTQSVSCILYLRIL